MENQVGQEEGTIEEIISADSLKVGEVMSC